MQPNRPTPPEARRGLLPSGTFGRFLFAVALLLLATLVWRADLALLSIRSLATALLLLALDPSTLKAIFVGETVEFWIATLYLVALPLTLFLILLRRRARQQREHNGEADHELSLGRISFRSFMRHSTALVASGVVLVLYSVAFTAPFIAPFSPYDQQDFLVTAYKPPFSTVEALSLAQQRGLSIPKREGKGLAVELANSLIADQQALRNRNVTNEVRYVESYRLEGGEVLYRQGMRQKSIPLDALATREGFATKRLFLLGTDQYGRDILSRILYGSRISLSIGFLVVLISVTLGTLIGVSSGYFGGWYDALMMRLVDVLIAFPALFLILIIIATFGNSIYLIVVTLSFTGWMGVARLVRSQVLSLKEQEFILAARSLGYSNLRILFRHLAPNTLTPVIIAATLRIGSIILTEAGLSFLGLGVQPPVPSWGNIINEGRDSLLNHWWISTFPGIAILTTVVCFNLIGDGVRDALDPRMRGEA